MREIKFRTWDKEDGFVYSDKTNCCHFDAVCYDNENIMQYTGLVDKNNKEIYEGDIIKLDGVCGDDGIYQIYYEEDFAGFAITKHIDKSSSESFGYGESHHCEVIGNIYENPELLK